MIIADNHPVFDRAPQLDQLRHDLAVLTSDVRGLELPAVILALLQRADELAVLADEPGQDLTAVRAFLGGDQ
jgi:hypothetical protein